jgi:hypothetical protein
MRSNTGRRLQVFRDRPQGENRQKGESTDEQDGPQHQDSRAGKAGRGGESGTGAGKAGRVRYWQYGQAEKSPDLAISDLSRFSRPNIGPVPLLPPQEPKQPIAVNTNRVPVSVSVRTGHPVEVSAADCGGRFGSGPEHDGVLYLS